MTDQISKLEEMREAIISGRLNRRQVLRRSLALGLSAPIIAALLAACGDDDDDDGGNEPTATTEAGGGAAETPTEGEATGTEGEATGTEGEATGTEGEATGTEAEATGTEGEATGTEGEATGTEGGSGDTGEFQSSDVDSLVMSKDIEEAPGQGGVLIEAGFSDIATLNPILTNDVPSSNFHSEIFEPLFMPDPDTLLPVGRLASEWSTSSDGLTWTIKLRDDVHWQDGEPFTADDVKVTYDLYMNPDSGSSRVGDFTSKIDSVEVVDDHTITFNLKVVVVDFPLDLGVYNIIADHIWSDVAPADIATDGGSNGEDAARVVGTGPFMFEEWVTEDHASAVRYDDYWAGTAVLDRYYFQVVQDQNAGVQQLKTGDVDWFAGVPESSVGEFDGTDVAIIDYPTLSFTFYGTNLDETKTTLFQEKEVRQALVYALDRQAMIDTIRFGYGEVAVGTMPVLSWAYNPDGIKLKYEYDPDKAKQLLDDAGWTEGGDGIREKDGQKLSFTMYTNAGNAIREQYLTIMQEYWREIGVEMSPQLEPFPALVERITQTFDFEVFLIGFNWNVPPDQSPMWATDSYPSDFNIVKYSNPDVDDLLAEALSEPDRDRRIELYTQMQNLVLEDVPMVVLDFPQGITGLSNRVHNVYPNSVNQRFNPHTWWVES